MLPFHPSMCQARRAERCVGMLQTSLHFCVEVKGSPPGTSEPKSPCWEDLRSLRNSSHFDSNSERSKFSSRLTPSYLFVTDLISKRRPKTVNVITRTGTQVSRRWEVTSRQCGHWSFAASVPCSRRTERYKCSRLPQ